MAFKNKKIAFVAVGLCLFFIALLFFLIPSFIVGIDAFFPKQVYKELSPDQQYSLIIFAKVDFPANEWLDPAGTVRVVVEETGGTKFLAQESFSVTEFGDISEPKVEWTWNEVIVREIDRRSGRVVKLTVR